MNYKDVFEELEFSYNIIALYISQKSQWSSPINHLAKSGKTMSDYGADWFEAELNDLAGCIQSLCTADLGAMATPADVTAGTPLCVMFAWEDATLTRASKWRGEPGSEKNFVARFARAVLALRAVREVTRIMELSSTTWHPKGIPMGLKSQATAGDTAGQR